MDPNGLLILYFVLLVGFTIAGIKKEGNSSPLSLQTLFNIPYSVYGMGAPINYFWLDLQLQLTYQKGSVIGMIEVMPYVIMGMVIFNLAYLYFVKRVDGPIITQNDPGENSDYHLIVTGLIAMVVSITVMLIGFAYMGFTVGKLLSVAYGEVRFISERGATLVHFSILFVGSSFFVATVLTRKRAWLTPPGIIAAMLIFSYLFLFLVHGKRATLAVMTVGLAVIYHHLKRPIGWGTFVPFFVLGSMLFVIIEDVRGIKRKTLSTLTEISTSVIHETEGWRGWAQQIFTQGDLLYGLEYAIETFPSYEPHLYGQTYIVAIIKLLPGFIWRDFQTIFQELWHNPLANFVVSPLAESYMNFGLAGIALSHLVYGSGLACLANRCRQMKSPLLSVSILAIISAETISMPRLPLSTGVLKSLVYESILVFMIFAIGSRISHRVSARISVDTPRNDRMDQRKLSSK